MRWKRWTLGDLLGPLSYFGKCSECHTQFMSTHDVVYVGKGSERGRKLCARCHGEETP